MKRLLSYSVVMFVITIILLLIIPLPAGLVDVAIILNMSLSMMILVITMTIREPLEFSIFPSLLLITTLFRLGINVSTTRNILSQGGSSGRVIAAFGDFVLRGNVVVGLIIFLIIVLMQFIVITKGAERVAEVAARFNLDAMPGKQMAIDADLSSGLINEAQAKERRAKVQREADFYGAMDGATKIVKGDAVMSLITTAINLIGGSIIGIVQSGSSISAVLSTYSIATVGDGLVSQIPALLISTATGMIVTRAVSEKRELGRTPTVDELAKHLGIEKKRCQRIISMKNRRNIQSLDFLLENQNTSNGLQITNNDTQVQPEEACLWEEDMRVLAEGIAQLNEKEQKTLALHYMEGLKMEQVGRVIGVSQPRASQIHTIALRKLRHFIETKNGKVKLKRELGRTPTVDELAKHLGIEKKRCQRIISMKNRGNIQSLDFLLENQNTSNGVRITNNDIQVQPEEACLWEEDMRVLAEGIAQLNEKEQKTLALHYMEGLKIEQVGRVMGVSQPRASQIHTMALRKLRQFIEKKNEKGIKSDVSGIL